jgi:diguanylate cyclase
MAGDRDERWLGPRRQVWQTEEIAAFFARARLIRMRNLFPLAGKAASPHWIVQTDYALRTLSFMAFFVAMAFDWAVRGASPVLWGMLILQFLVYPHLVYWRARRAAQPHDAELSNLLLDSLLIGVWVGVLDFSLWPSFALWLCSTLNLTIIRGARGLRDAQILFLAGVLLSVTVFGFRFVPHTVWPTTFLLMFGISAYLIAIANASNSRNMQLRKTREQLRMGEQAMHANNEVLEQRLAEIEVLQERLKEQALRDPMTGLFNRRYLDTAVPAELARCEREQAPLALLMIDLDHFKRVNDTYGHQGGDAVLKALAALLLANVRASDVACRYGGEEFLLLLPATHCDAAIERAEQWRAAFAATTVDYEGTPIQATLSIGIACYPQDGKSIEDLTRCADQALYQAKEQGRNRVVLFRSPNPIQNPTISSPNCVI